MSDLRRRCGFLDSSIGPADLLSRYVEDCDTVGLSGGQPTRRSVCVLPTAERQLESLLRPLQTAANVLIHAEARLARGYASRSRSSRS
jgi:hypothetical protein